MTTLTAENAEKLDKLINLENQGKLFGRFEDIPECVYHHPDCPGVGSTTLKKLKKSMAHKLADDANVTDAQYRDRLLGRSFHCFVLEGQDEFSKRFAIEPERPDFGDCRKKENKAKRDQWLNEVYHEFEQKVGSREVIPSTMWETLTRMIEEARNNPYLVKVLENSNQEVSYFDKCPETGITRKCRPDILALNDKFSLLCDVKTCADASFIRFGKDCVEMEYELQLAYYHDIVCNVEEIFEVPCAFFAAEKKLPFQNTFYNMLQAQIDVGRDLYKRRMKYLKKIQSDEVSAGLPQGFSDMYYPAYAYDIESRAGACSNV